MDIQRIEYPLLWYDITMVSKSFKFASANMTNAIQCRGSQDPEQNTLGIKEIPHKVSPQTDALV